MLLEYGWMRHLTTPTVISSPDDLFCDLKFLWSRPIWSYNRETPKLSDVVHWVTQTLVTPPLCQQSFPGNGGTISSQFNTRTTFSYFLAKTIPFGIFGWRGIRKCLQSGREYLGKSWRLSNSSGFVSFVWKYLEYILRTFVGIVGSQLVIMKRRRLFDFCQTIFVCTINLIASACQTTMLNFGVVMMW